MPAIVFDSVPMPSLRVYVTISVLCLAAVFISDSSIQLPQKPEDTVQKYCHAPTYMEVMLGLAGCQSADIDDFRLSSLIDVLIESSFTGWFLETIFKDFYFACAMINACYCFLILLGHVITRVVFVQLREVESQHMKDKFWNLLFYKFIFVFGVLNVQSVEEVLLWALWFSVVGFIALFTQLATDRLAYISFSPATPRHIHVRLLGLLMFLLSSALGSLSLAYMDVQPRNPAVFLFMAADCTILMLKVTYVLVRYSLHLYDLSQEGVWERRAQTVYYTELGFELCMLSLDFINHIYMLFYGQIYLSMASLVICMQLRHLFHEIQRRWHRHCNYRRVVAHMEQRFPWCSDEELAANDDNCAICWDAMERARKLPCGHIFHNSCLRSWLEQDTCCPTCRHSLNEQEQATPPHRPAVGVAGQRAVAAAQPGVARNTFNHFFHFDGPRYVSWLPRFSVEVSHTRFDPLRNRQTTEANSSQLDEMVGQVQAVLPHLPPAMIREDLMSTRSVHMTIENLLDAQTSEIQHESSDEQSDSEPERLYLPELGIRDSGDTEVIPDVTEGLDSEQTAGSSVAGRFSKSAPERENILRTRKQQLLLAAKRRYMQKQTEDSEPDDSRPSGSQPTSSQPSGSQLNSLQEEALD